MAWSYRLDRSDEIYSDEKGPAVTAGTSQRDTLTAPYPDISSGGAEVPLTFQYSLSRAGNTVNLTNDATVPGASKYYGTNASGVRGFFALSAGGGVTFVEDFPALRAVPTTALAAKSVMQIVVRLISGSWSGSGWFLIAGTTADDGANVIRPTDYATTTNEKIWVKLWGA
jgi:hypothetical protein